MKQSEVIQSVSRCCRERHYELSTERSYRDAALNFIHWCKSSEVKTNEDRVTAYLSERAENWSESSQRLCLNALVFMFKSIGKPLGKLPEWTAAKRPPRLPEWLTHDEATKTLDMLRGEDRLACSLMYGAGLRRSEAVGLRFRDVNAQQGCLTVRGGKGDKDRTTCLPFSILPAIEEQMKHAEAIWREDRDAGRGGVYVPPVVTNKQPNAGSEIQQFWIFPARNLSRDPRIGAVRRHHLHEESVATALRTAAKRAGLFRRITCHALRHSFATEFLLQGGTIHELKELLGHANIATTEIYLHCLPQLGGRIRSPLDREQTNVVPFSTPQPSIAAHA